MTARPSDLPSDLPAEDGEAALSRVSGWRMDLAGAAAAPGPEVPLEVPVETPIGIAYGKAPVSVPYAVVMASPVDLEDLVIGFSLTEGIVDRACEVRSVAIMASGEGPAVGGIMAIAEISGKSLSRHLARRRNLTSRTGCGLCGIEEVADLPQARPPAGPAPELSRERLTAMLAGLETRQVLHARTRAMHAAAWFDAAGRLVAVREDVGRHNALDKLIGALARRRVPPDGGAVLITSRCSFEMIEKAAVFGARLVVAVSAPTSLAIERARALGVTLVAVARADAAVLFTPAPACPPQPRPAHKEPVP
jgi:FdhD protein